ncbi:hypothetical protein POSPLADRAFT_1044775 [Postia placenta MAD-698-R-SB12]|uniref:Uncharacterized protein n=1 Tax=Postia placenta MAD-698-R-SB12 TaxID=670580 RepID=A0A1X6N9S0_9APHY|nr:hypothetical protein POSPLADRAFT_1044775 [Postia placenta MAD-698-R-SB12]OSX65398.1 hypothetical protein POSPLADRAFT_1044775 [Postia placenta MAD-698-R-SB12]
MLSTILVTSVLEILRITSDRVPVHTRTIHASLHSVRTKITRSQKSSVPQAPQSLDQDKASSKVNEAQRSIR